MKKKLFFLACMLVCFSSAQAQYKGSSYLVVEGGVSMDMGKSGLSVGGAPSPGVQFSVGYGRYLGDKWILELPAHFHTANNKLAEIKVFSFTPTLSYALYKSGKVLITAGFGLMGGMQTAGLRTQEELVSLTGDKDRFVYGGSLTPRVDYLISGRIGLRLSYRFTYQVDAAYQVNNLLSGGVVVYL